MRKNENINDFNNSLQKITYGVKFLYDSDNTPTSTKSNEKEVKEKLLNMIEDKWLRRQLEDMLDELYIIEPPIRGPVGVKFSYGSDNTPTSTKSNEKERKGEK